MRLDADIWAIPAVRMMGIHADGPQLHDRMVIPTPNRDVSRRIYEAERSYLQATPEHQFNLQVVPASRVSITMPEPFEALLER